MDKNTLHKQSKRKTRHIGKTNVVFGITLVITVLFHSSTTFRPFRILPDHPPGIHSGMEDHVMLKEFEVLFHFAPL